MEISSTAMEFPKEHLGDNPSEGQNISRQDYSEEEDKESYNVSKPSMSSREILDPSSNYSFIKFIPNDLLFEYFCERDFNNITNVPKEISTKINEPSTENITSSAEASDASFSEKSKLSEVAMSYLYKEPESTNKTEFPEGSKSSEKAFLEFIKEIKLPEVIPSKLPGGTTSTKLRQSFLSRETGSTGSKLASLHLTEPIQIHPRHCKKGRSTDILHSAYSKELNGNNLSRSLLNSPESSYGKKPRLSSCKSEVATNIIQDPSSVSKNSSIRYSSDFQILNSESRLSSTRITAKKMDELDNQQSTEDFKNKKQFVNKPHCDDHSTINLSNMKFEPFFTNFKSPPVSLPSKKSSVKSSTVSLTISAGSTQSVLIRALIKWVEEELEKFSNCTELSKISDFQDIVKKEFQHGKKALMQLIVRVDILLGAVNGLLHPGSISLPELGDTKSLIRDALNDAGFKVRRRSENLLKETTEYCNRFDLACHKYSEASKDELESWKVEKIGIFNTFVSIFESMIMLRSEIENFRVKIAEFCFTIESLM